MKYYVIADPHGFASKTRAALAEAGFFDDPGEKRLIVLGDLMDRGPEAEDMQTLACGLLDEDLLVYVRGNHEDLMVEMLDRYYAHRLDLVLGRSHHLSNGTFDTALQLTHTEAPDAFMQPIAFLRAVRETPFLTRLIPASVDYFETKHYVFVHGWVPCEPGEEEPLGDWRNAHRFDWESARWLNGMAMAQNSRLTVPGKTVFCGHFHTSWGHSLIEKNGPEFGDGAVFTPYYGKGVTALDGCTAYSGIVNCLVVEDDPLPD